MKHLLALATFFLLFGVLAWHLSIASFRGIDLSVGHGRGKDGAHSSSLARSASVRAARTISEGGKGEAPGAERAEMHSAADSEDRALRSDRRVVSDVADPGGPPQRVARRPDTPPSREVYVQHYPGGQKQVEGERRYGRREGIWTEWTETGVVQSRGEYKDDQRVGIWQFYHPSGELAREGLYVDGRMEGVWTAWGENGRPVREGRLVRGEPEDVWTEWYSNGQVRETGRYEHGRREDYWQFFDFDGRADLRRTGHYRNGRRIR